MYAYSISFDVIIIYNIYIIEIKYNGVDYYEGKEKALMNYMVQVIIIKKIRIK